MLVIPVIDLKDGLAVHAKGGRRNAYAPVRSMLCPSPQPGDVIDAYLRLFPFSHIYIADLDALAGDTVRHAMLKEELAHAYSGVEFWIDAGLELPKTGCAWRPVLGTESLSDSEQWEQHRHLNPILSLDFRGDHLLTDAPFDTGSLNADDVIVMELDRVGAAGGPGLERLRSLRATRPEARLYAAGGIQGLDDLRGLRDAGVSGALIATALHDGRLTAEHLSAAGNY